MNRKALPLLLSLALTQLGTGADISHRKADLTVEVQSVSGTPLEGATVEIEMLNHAFRFGCAVEHHIIDPNSNRYDAFTVEQLQKYFNSATYGNIMKWTYYEARTDEQNKAIAALPQSFNAFDGPDNLRLRGHVTVWGSSYQVPNRVRNSNDGAYIHEQILDHVEAYHTTFKDSGIDSYDLYNEHFAVPELLVDKIASPSDMAAQAAEVATWFNKAKETDPNAVLYINDFNILNDWNGNDSRVHAYKAFVDAIRDAGGNIDGIGLQAHMDRPTTSKADVTRRLDILAAPMAATANYPEGLPGLRLEITELDMSIRNRFFNNTWGWPNPTIEDEVAVARAVLEGAFEHPSVDGITIWGLDDFSHWRGNAIMFDNLQDDDSGTSRSKIDPVLKETGQLWVDKVTKEWWENHAGNSSSNGEYAANTFKGTHRVTVTFNGQTQTAVANLSGDGTLNFKFAAEPKDASTYESWGNLVIWNGETSDRDEDPDNDGITNLEEFLTGTDPLVFNLQPQVEIVKQGQIQAVATYTTRANDDGVIHNIEWSQNLKDWEPWTPSPESTPGIEILDGTAVHTIPLTQEAGPNFYRFTLKEKE